MLKYEEFYKVRGTRYVRDMLTPIVWSAEVIAFPHRSMLYWFNGTLTREHPTREYGYFANLNKPQVYSVLEYVTDDLLGKPKSRKVNESALIKEGKSKEPSFKYVRSGRKMSVSPASEVLFNLGSIGSGYRYAAHPLTAYYVWHNNLATTVSLVTAGVTGATRHKYIFMKLPYAIPERRLVNEYLGEPTRAMLRAFPDSDYFNIMELFRFVNKEHRKYSILANGLNEDELKNTDLVLTINNKVCIINLGLLASVSDAHSVTSALKKYPTEILTKIMYIFLSKILEAAPMTVLDTTIDGSDANLANLTEVGADVVVEKVSLDNILENEISESEVVDIPDDDVIATVRDDLDKIKSGLLSNGTTDDDLVSEPALADNSQNLELLDVLKDSKIITRNMRDNLSRVLEDQAARPSPYNDGRTIGDMLAADIDDITTSKEASIITDTPAVLDKLSNTNPLRAINDRYREKSADKDIMSTLYSLQRNRVIITDHTILNKRDALGDTDEHTLTLQAIDGSKSTVRVVVPRISGDNTLRMSGNECVIRKQRSDIPVIKISNDTVTLSSSYGKLFITRGTFKKDDLGYWFHNRLIKMYATTDELRDIAAVPVVAPDAITPPHYGMIGRYIKGFRYEGIVFSFDYAARVKLYGKSEVAKAEKSGVVVGIKNKTLVVMRDDNQLQLMDKATTPLGDIFDLLDMDTTKAPIEYCNARVFKKQIPVAVLLAYYMGYTKLLSVLDVEYTTVDTGKRTKLLDNQYRLVFKDTTYIINRDYGKADLIISGLASLKNTIKRLPVKVLETRASYAALFTAMELPVLYVKEIELMGNMFIDPMTRQNLVLMKYPESFRGILVKAAELLTDDNYVHPKNIKGSVLKGYERVSGMLYLEIVNALRTHANKSHFGKSKITMPPYGVLKRISEDSTTVLVDDLNPISALKQHEDVTYLGLHGRREETMSAATRVMHPSEIGVISEAVKDSGAVGISAYLSAAPNITTTRGTVEGYKEGDGWSTILSTPAMLAPFATKDDSKRLNFASIMASHVIPMRDMHVPYVRTGEESIVGVKTIDKFVTSALEAGRVTIVTTDMITVKYDSLGVKKYKLLEWTSKEEAGITYTHKLVANLKKGDTFTKDDSIAYDETFFEPDLFSPKRVIFRSGSSLVIATMESPETYEDSTVISSEFSKSMGTVVTRVSSVTMTNEDNVVNVLVVGDKTEPKTPLLSIVDKSLNALSNLDAKALEILKGLKMLSPKADYRGTISKMRVYYNCELSELPQSIKKLAIISDAELMSETGTTGMVDSGYSIRGIPLPIGGVEIKYYIKTGVGMGTADKGILGNQLKFTVGDVYHDPIYAEDGTVVDGVTSTRSIEARIVNSPGLIGTLSTLLELTASAAVDAYFD